MDKAVASTGAAWRCHSRHRDKLLTWGHPYLDDKEIKAVLIGVFSQHVNINISEQIGRLGKLILGDGWKGNAPRTQILLHALQRTSSNNTLQFARGQ
jgi:hypothetical protein